MPRIPDARAQADTLGGRLTRCRLKLGLTQQELATATGTSQAVIQRIEAGKCRHPRNIRRLAEAVGVGPAWLMYGVEVVGNLEQEAVETARAWRALDEPQRSAIKEMIFRLATRPETARAEAA